MTTASCLLPAGGRADDDRRGPRQAEISAISGEFEAPLSGCRLLAADLDGDRRDEIVCANERELDFVIYRFERPAALIKVHSPVNAEAATQSSSPSYHSLATGDLDGDGREDLIALSADRTAVIWTSFSDDFAPSTVDLPLGFAAPPANLLVSREDPEQPPLLWLAPTPPPRGSGEVLAVKVSLVEKRRFESRGGVPVNRLSYPRQALVIEPGGGELTAARTFQSETCQISIAKKGVASIWAEFPCQGERNSTGEILFGDFTGDGREDALSVAQLPSGSWLVIGDSRGGVEIPVRFKRLAAEISGEEASVRRLAVRFFDKREQILEVAGDRAVIYEVKNVDDARWRRLAHQPHGPRPCIGYQPTSKISKWGRTAGLCAPHHAVMEVDEASSCSREGCFVACCPLPRADLLSDEHREISLEQSCPPEHVVTGMTHAPGRVQVRCTRINSARYRLGTPRGGRYWGVGLSAPGNRDGIDRQGIDPALRPAVGRLSYGNWDTDGCIAGPAGALLISAPQTRCERDQFAEIFEVGQARPLKLLPDCAAEPSPFAPFSACREPD